MSENLVQYKHQMYCKPGGLINAEAFRSAATTNARRTGETAILHHHGHGEPCKGKHEYITASGIEEKEL